MERETGLESAYFHCKVSQAVASHWFYMHSCCAYRGLLQRVSPACYPHVSPRAGEASGFRSFQAGEKTHPERIQKDCHNECSF